MQNRKPDANDEHIGTRIRLRRAMLGMTQQEFGRKIGVTFQQVQKYEKGINRIGAGKLLTIAKALHVPVLYFFEGAPDMPSQPENADETEQLTTFMTNKETIKLILAFNQIQNSKIRTHLVRLTDTIANSSPS